MVSLAILPYASSYSTSSVRKAAVIPHPALSFITSSVPQAEGAVYILARCGSVAADRRYAAAMERSARSGAPHDSYWPHNPNKALPLSSSDMPCFADHAISADASSSIPYMQIRGRNFLEVPQRSKERSLDHQLFELDIQRSCSIGYARPCNVLEMTKCSKQRSSDMALFKLDIEETTAKEGLFGIKVYTCKYADQRVSVLRMSGRTGSFKVYMSREIKIMQHLVMTKRCKGEDYEVYKRTPDCTCYTKREDRYTCYKKREGSYTYICGNFVRIVQKSHFLIVIDSDLQPSTTFLPILKYSSPNDFGRSALPQPGNIVAAEGRDVHVCINAGAGISLLRHLLRIGCPSIPEDPFKFMTNCPCRLPSVVWHDIPRKRFSVHISVTYGRWDLMAIMDKLRMQMLPLLDDFIDAETLPKEEIAGLMNKVFQMHDAGSVLNFHALKPGLENVAGSGVEDNKLNNVMEVAKLFISSLSTWQAGSPEWKYCVRRTFCIKNITCHVSCICLF